jgi:hypothetical protein
LKSHTRRYRSTGGFRHSSKVSPPGVNITFCNKHRSYIVTTEGSVAGQTGTIRYVIPCLLWRKLWGVCFAVRSVAGDKIVSWRICQSGVYDMKLPVSRRFYRSGVEETRLSGSQWFCHSGFENMKLPTSRIFNFLVWMKLDWPIIKKQQMY